MNRKSTSAVGAFHPVLFFVAVYGISLFLSFFVCRSVYYGLHEEDAVTEKEAKKVKKDFHMATAALTTTAYK
jgi:cytosine/uracil/thiamine/allantoin permease